MTRPLLVLLCACACDRVPAPERVYPSRPVAAERVDPPVAAERVEPVPVAAERVEPSPVAAERVEPSPVAAERVEPSPVPPPAPEPPLAKRSVSAAERALAGTWVAEVDARATRTRAVAGAVMFGLPPGKDLVSGVLEAVESDNRVPTSCVWLELYDDGTGFRNECALIGGQPSALDKTDPLTGKRSRFGVAFEWRLEGPETVSIRLREPLLVKRGTLDLEVKRWHLALRERDGTRFRAREIFPEHDYELPVRYDWEIFLGRYLGE